MFSNEPKRKTNENNFKQQKCQATPKRAYVK